MSFLAKLAHFAYDFVIGDDWTVAAAVVAALIVVSLLVRVHATIWWLLPLVVILVLGTSLWRGAQHR